MANAVGVTGWEHERAFAVQATNHPSWALPGCVMCLPLTPKHSGAIRQRIWRSYALLYSIHIYIHTFKYHQVLQRAHQPEGLNVSISTGFTSCASTRMDRCQPGAAWPHVHGDVSSGGCADAAADDARQGRRSFLNFICCTRAGKLSRSFAARPVHV